MKKAPKKAARQGTKSRATKGPKKAAKKAATQGPARGAKKGTGKKAGPSTTRGERLYTLEVFIIGGPVTERFAKRNPVVSRTIQIRGSQTLETLHHAIFDALDRFDEHMYEFQFGKRPNDPRGKRYVLPFALQDNARGRGGVADLTQTTIDSLELKVRRSFGYWFDFGDDWWHQVDVVAIDDEVPAGKFPRVIKEVGQSPPQYVDWDEEER